MTTRTLLLGMLLLAGTVATAACNKADAAVSSPLCADGAPAPTGACAAAEVVNIAVDGNGFVPASIHASRGKKLVLRFTRTSDQTCAKNVYFPELKMTRDLPLNQPIEIEVPTDQARTIIFECAMGMFKSEVIVH